MKIYIAGPITGHDPDTVKKRFGSAAAELRDLGFEPVNPDDMSGWGLSWETYMCLTLEILRSDEIDAVYMLKDWMLSEGARVERNVAKIKKIPIYYESDGWIQKLKERAERPYDAMGDDQGRGGSVETKVEDPGDTWYRENFVDYKGSPDALIEAIKRGDGIPQEKREVKK